VAAAGCGGTQARTLISNNFYTNFISTTMDTHANNDAPGHATNDQQAARTPNHLIHESSPYLLQHAYNPVQWYPWSPEALDRARQENKPILISIGYAACHWCHVMERESFEDQKVADF